MTWKKNALISVLLIALVTSIAVTAYRTFFLQDFTVVNHLPEEDSEE